MIVSAGCYAPPWSAVSGGADPDHAIVGGGEAGAVAMLAVGSGHGVVVDSGGAGSVAMPAVRSEGEDGAADRAEE